MVQALPSTIRPTALPWAVANCGSPASCGRIGRIQLQIRAMQPAPYVAPFQRIHHLDSSPSRQIGASCDWATKNRNSRSCVASQFDHLAIERTWQTTCGVLSPEPWFPSLSLKRQSSEPRLRHFRREQSQRVSEFTCAYPSFRYTLST